MYEKQTWVSGEIVTEGKLNHMEEGIATGGGIYSLENVVYYDGEVTTTDEAQLGGFAGDIYFDKLLPEKEIQVTFNGTKYTLPIAKNPVGQIAGWGENGDNFQHVFSNYPIFIDYREDLESNVSVYTAETGTYSLTVKGEGLQINSKFKESLNSVIVPSGEIRYDVYVEGGQTRNFIEVDEDLSSVAEKNLIFSPNINKNSIILVKWKEDTVYPASSSPSGTTYLYNECQYIPIAYIDAGQEDNSLEIFQACIVKKGTATFKNNLD